MNIEDICNFPEFKQNKYSKWYFSIIDRAISQNRKKTKRGTLNYEYLENHHILPKCIWPQFKNLKIFAWNKVLLTAKEHFIIHLCLIRMMNSTKHMHQMKSALHKMQFSGKAKERYTSKLFVIKRMCFPPHPNKGKKLGPGKNRGKPLTYDIWNKGKKFTEENHSYKGIIERMKNNNPMHNPDTAKKSINSRRSYSGKDNPAFGKKWMNDGTQITYVPSNLHQEFLDAGWKFGSKGCSERIPLNQTSIGLATSHAR